MFGAFYFIAGPIILQGKTALDAYADNFFTPVTSSSTTRLMTDITFFGSSYFLFPSYVLLISYFLFARKNIRLAGDVAIVGFIGNQLLYLMQYVFHRQRPADPLIQNVTGYSFPSGHSFAAFTFFGLLAYITWQTQLQKVTKVILCVMFFIIATIIAGSRVYLHVHYASDVLGGFWLSMIWLSLSLWVLNEADKRILLLRGQ